MPDPSNATEFVTRPSGKVYRRRKPIEVQSLAWNDEGTCVMVYGTHDTKRAEVLAASEWASECEGPLPEPKCIWIKKVPWDPFGYGWASTVMEVSGDMKGSTPAVQFWIDPWCREQIKRDDNTKGDG